jgi:hypothetical protein
MLRGSITAPGWRFNYMLKIDVFPWLTTLLAGPLASAAVLDIAEEIVAEARTHVGSGISAKVDFEATVENRPYGDFPPRVHGLAIMSNETLPWLPLTVEYGSIKNSSVGRAPMRRAAASVAEGNALHWRPGPWTKTRGGIA